MYCSFTQNSFDVEQCLKMLNDWGPDIFQITEVAANRPLTFVVYSILKVSSAASASLVYNIDVAGRSRQLAVE